MAKTKQRKPSKALAVTSTRKTTSELDVIQIDDKRSVPVTSAILDLETKAKAIMVQAGEEFTRHGLRLVVLARQLMPVFAAWCKLLDLPERGSADRWLARIDPAYSPSENRTAGSHSLSMLNRWRNLQAAYAMDNARTQIEAIAKLSDGDDARRSLIDALEDSERKAIAKLDLSDSPELAEARAEAFGLSTTTTNAVTRVSATDIRNGLAATILALTPAAARDEITEALIKRMALSEGAAKAFRTTGVAVKPWIVCEATAKGVAVTKVPKATAQHTEAETEAEAPARGRRRAAA